jgi:hypothetical protein
MGIHDTAPSMRLEHRLSVHIDHFLPTQLIYYAYQLRLLLLNKLDQALILKLAPPNQCRHDLQALLLPIQP